MMERMKMMMIALKSDFLFSFERWVVLNFLCCNIFSTVQMLRKVIFNHVCMFQFVPTTIVSKL